MSTTENIQDMNYQTVDQSQSCVDWKCGKNTFGACLPLLIFVIFVSISMIVTIFTPGTLSSKMVNFFVSILWYILWGFIIYMLCKSGNYKLAWTVLFLPLIIWFILTLLILFGLVVM